MSATLELFVRWKALKGITSDRQGALALKLSEGAAAQWRAGRNGSAAVIAGWRLRGRWLISPCGERLNPERLRGILFREAGEKRVSRAKLKNGQQGMGIRLLRHDGKPPG